MTISYVSTHKEFLIQEELISADIFDDVELAEVIENISNKLIDFHVGNYRFVKTSELVGVLAEDLKDSGSLGHFNASFLARHVPHFNVDDITALQGAMHNDYDESGMHGLILSLMGNDLTEFAQAYINEDGAGHAFAHYDHKCLEVEDYSYFRVE